MTLRSATADDFEAANRVIEAAVMTWDLPERVKYLAIPSYLYRIQDLGMLDMIVAEGSAADIYEVIAWEAADPKDTPPPNTVMLLQGIGTQLLSAASAIAA